MNISPENLHVQFLGGIEMTFLLLSMLSYNVCLQNVVCDIAFLLLF